MFTASDQGYIILQSTLLTGITSISFSQDINEDAVNLLSNRGINRKIKGPPTTTCQITKTYAGKDFFTDLTGFVGLSGQFGYGNDALDFTDAAISNYSLRMDAQGAPEISVDLKIFGDLKPATGDQLRKSCAASDITKKNISASSTKFNYMGKNSPISQFSVSAAFELKPTYEIESIKSSAVRIVPPVKFLSSATMELTEQEYENVSGLLESENYDRSISLVFNDGSTGNTLAGETLADESGRFFALTSSGLETGLHPEIISLIKTGTVKLNPYEFEGFGLKSQNISLTTNDTIKLDASFDGYSTNLPIGNAPSTPVRAGLESLTNKINAVIENLTTGLLAIPKVTGDAQDFAGEDFQSLGAGSTNLSRISKHLNKIFKSVEVTDFQGETVGNVTTNLVKMGLGGGEEIFPVEVTDFQDQSVGATNLNLNIPNLVPVQIIDFQSETVGSTDTDLTSFE